MTDCVRFTPDLLPSLTRLLNAQLPAIPPGWTLAEHQVMLTIASAAKLWSVHYPDQKASFEMETLCVVQRGQVLAAAQWGYPIPGESAGLANSGVLFWIVAGEDNAEGISLLLKTLVFHAHNSGCPRMTTTRFSYGAGWLGIPAIWQPVTSALQSAGFVPTNRWRIFTIQSRILETTSPAALQSMDVAWEVNEPAAEWDLRLYDGHSLVGECSAWGMPPHFSGCPGYENWITIEWLGVETAYQRQGLGRWLLAEQLRRQAQQGIQQAILWTETGNQPMLELCKLPGFQAGPECWDFEIPLSG